MTGAYFLGADADFYGIRSGGLTVAQGGAEPTLPSSAYSISSAGYFIGPGVDNQYIDFAGQSFVNDILTGADFGYSDFTGDDMTGADFTDGYLTGATSLVSTLRTDT